MKCVGRYLGIVVMFVALSGVLATAPVTAAGTADGGDLTVVVYCENTSRGRFFCDALADGGISPYTYRWTLSFGAWTKNPNGSTIIGNCSIGRISTISVAVTDSLGATATDTTSLFCSSIAP